MNPELSPPETTLTMPDSERMTRNKALLLDALKVAGAILASVTYRGGGDEGTDDGVTAFDANNAAVDLSDTVSLFCERYYRDDQDWKTKIEQKDQPLDEALTDYAMEAVNQHRGGWEDGEGGYGEVVFDCETNTVRIEHNDYYIESEYTEIVL